MAITIAGSILATRIFFPQIRLIPTQKISMEPIIDKLERASFVIIGLASFASKVIDPCKTATGMAEKIQPFPMAQVMTIIMMKSSIALVAKTE